MTVLRDMRSRIEALENRQCNCLPDHREWAVPLACALAAVGLFVSIAISTFAPSDRHAAELACIAARGQWSAPSAWGGNYTCRFDIARQ